MEQVYDHLDHPVEYYREIGGEMLCGEDGIYLLENGSIIAFIPNGMGVDMEAGIAYIYNKEENATYSIPLD